VPTRNWAVLITCEDLKLCSQVPLMAILRRAEVGAEGTKIRSCRGLPGQPEKNEAPLGELVDFLLFVLLLFLG